MTFNLTRDIKALPNKPNKFADLRIGSYIGKTGFGRVEDTTFIKVCADKIYCITLPTGNIWECERSNTAPLKDVEPATLEHICVKVY